MSLNLLNLVGDLTHILHCHQCVEIAGTVVRSTASSPVQASCCLALSSSDGDIMLGLWSQFQFGQTIYQCALLLCLITLYLLMLWCAGYAHALRGSTLLAAGGCISACQPLAPNECTTHPQTVASCQCRPTTLQV